MPMTRDIKNVSSMQRIADMGEKIYVEKYKDRLEKESGGHFAAIDVLSGNAYVGEFPELAIEKAQKESPTGVFHLIRIGSPGAFKSSRICGEPNVGAWPF